MNIFRTIEERALLGIWQALATPYTAEICATTGFDWLLFDGEHAPNTLQTLLAQLQAVAAYPVEPVARVPVGDAVIIKQYLDIGFKTLLVPMVESGEQAQAMVSATCFPPFGVRGVASALSRASRFGSNASYLTTAHEDLFLILQIESAAGLAAVDSILAVPGVDAIFLGPADLAASLGYLGRPAASEVQAAILHALARARAAGKPAGIFATSPEDARERIAQGFQFVSIGTDVGLLSGGARGLLKNVMQN